MKTISIDGEKMFLYLIQWGKYEVEDVAVVAHRERLTEAEIRTRLAGGVVTSARQPFPEPEQLAPLGFVLVESIELHPGYMGT